MKLFLRTAALIAVSAAAAGAQTVYNNNGTGVAGFSANAQNWSTPNNCTSSTFCGSYIGSTGGPAGYWGGGVGHTFGNTDVATLSLSGLGSHTGGTLFFTLFIIDSWDGDAFNCCGPDQFRVSVNGNELLHTTFADPAFLGSELQSYPNPFPAGFGSHLPGDGATENGGLGSWYWTSASDNNSVYEIALSFADASSVLNVDFEGITDNQGFGDESWALQHVQVDLRGGVTATPEPASLSLFATGLVGLGAAVRRRKKSAQI